jgi:hypothetical protein
MENEKIVEIFQKVMNLSEDKAKLALFGLIMVTEGGGHISIEKIIDKVQ